MSVIIASGSIAGTTASITDITAATTGVKTGTMADTTTVTMTVTTGRIAMNVTGDTAVTTIMMTGARTASGAGIGYNRRILKAIPAPRCLQTMLRQESARACAGAPVKAPVPTELAADLPVDAQKNRELEAFFIASEDKAFHVAFAALWDREAALDAVQESMTRLVAYYRDKPATQWPALFRTILNSKINDIRRRRMIEQGKHKLVSLTGLFRHHQEDPRDDTEYEIPAADRDDGITAPEVGALAAELRGKVADALQSLSMRQRQVFILREWRGMSIRETAQTLGCSENSVKQHHFRAMRELRRQLAEVWNHA